jgi:hypothetical protein
MLVIQGALRRNRCSSLASLIFTPFCYYGNVGRRMLVRSSERAAQFKLELDPGSSGGRKKTKCNSPRARVVKTKESCIEQEGFKRMKNRKEIISSVFD